MITKKVSTACYSVVPKKLQMSCALRERFESHEINKHQAHPGKISLHITSPKVTGRALPKSLQSAQGDSQGQG